MHFVILYIIVANICVFSMFQALRYLLNIHYVIWSSYQPWVIRTITFVVVVKRHLSVRELEQGLMLGSGRPRLVGLWRPGS